MSVSLRELALNPRSNASLFASPAPRTLATLFEFIC